MKPSVRHLIAFLISGVFFVVLVTTAQDLGFARDEGFYYRGANDYQAWFDELVQDPGSALSKQSVDNHWQYNHEHPALMKILFGFSIRIFHQWLGLFRPSTAARLPGMFMGALCIYLTILWASRFYGKMAGISSGIFLALCPRFFYHSHLCCFDVPVTAMWLLTFYAFLRGLTSKKWAVFSGVAFGLCLCTKLNSFFIPVVLLIHFALIRWSEFRRDQKHRTPIPMSFFYMAVLGPLIFFIHWPWIWFETLDRIGFYIGFHRAHPYYNMEYFGQTYFRPPLPVSYPFVMTAITVPATTLLLCFTGLAKRISESIPDKWRARLSLDASDKAERIEAIQNDLLVMICLIFPIVVIALPSVPIFGGTKHWLPALPFLCMLAGVGFSLTIKKISGIFGRFGKVFAVVISLILVGPALNETISSHPFGLTHYNILTGGVQGAAQAGFNRQFWGYATGGLLDYLNENVPSHGRVFFHDTAYDAFLMYRDDGTIRSDIRFSDVQSSDFALVHHEQHMAHVEYEIWQQYQTTSPVLILTHQGVPVISVYRRPERFADLEP